MAAPPVAQPAPPAPDLVRDGDNIVLEENGGRLTAIRVRAQQ
jgi:hypothetical protein